MSFIMVLQVPAYVDGRLITDSTRFRRSPDALLSLVFLVLLGTPVPQLTSEHQVQFSFVVLALVLLQLHNADGWHIAP